MSLVKLRQSNGNDGKPFANRGRDREERRGEDPGRASSADLCSCLLLPQAGFKRGEAPGSARPERRTRPSTAHFKRVPLDPFSVTLCIGRNTMVK